MELTSTSSLRSQPSPSSSLGATLHAQALKRFSRGLLATGLLEDLRTGGPFTLLAPVDAAFDSLPFRFDRMLNDPALVEARFDLFEYLVLRGHHEATAERRTLRSVQGEHVRLARGLALGRFGASRILTTFSTDTFLVHVLEQCVFPVVPRSYLVDIDARALAL